MSKQDKNNIEAYASERTKVAKDSKLALIKDKLLFLGVAAVCILIGITSFFPKHKIKTLIEYTEKEDTTATLRQNMALIAALKKETAIKAELTNTNNSPPKLRKDYPNKSLTKEILARMNAPSTFFSISSETSNVDVAQHPQGKTFVGHDTNSDFLNQQNNITSVTAKQLPHPAFTVPSGEMIPATLETAIHSELAGMVRAITTRDIYALSGNQLLIPKGSTLVGQFNTAITQGQSRMFVIWNRVQMTNGVIVTMNSPSADSIGRAGLAADYIDSHFFERFGSSALLSILGGYAAMGGVKGQDEYNSIAQYRMSIANSFQQSANQSFQQDMLTRPTLAINQGTTINVFVAHDLDFYRVAKRI